MITASLLDDPEERGNPSLHPGAFEVKLSRDVRYYERNLHKYTSGKYPGQVQNENSLFKYSSSWKIDIISEVRHSERICRVWSFLFVSAGAGHLFQYSGRQGGLINYPHDR
jgi:hypothetical protein